MGRLVESLAGLFALAAAMLAALAGAWQAFPLPALVLRAVVVGALVYGFVRLAGNLAGRALLRDLAEDELRRNQSDGTEPASGKSSTEERKVA